MNAEAEAGGIQHQLEQIYADQERLAQEVGVCDAEGIISMVRNLESQLCDLYNRYGGITDIEGGTGILLAQVQRLASELDEDYSQKSITLEIVDDKPVLRAQWTEHLVKGAHE